jgi:hypothetical protein
MSVCRFSQCTAAAVLVGLSGRDFKIKLINIKMLKVGKISCLLLPNAAIKAASNRQKNP